MDIGLGVGFIIVFDDMIGGGNKRLDTILTHGFFVIFLEIFSVAKFIDEEGCDLVEIRFFFIGIVGLSQMNDVLQFLG